MSRKAVRVRSSALFFRSFAGETEKGEKVVVLDDALVPAVCPVDDLDPRRAVSYNNYRFYAIPSFVDLDSAPFRTIPVGGPSRIVPFVSSLAIRGASLLVDTVNVHLTPLIGTNRLLRAAAGEQGRKETSATTMILARKVEVKRPGRHGKSRGWRVARRPDHGHGDRGCRGRRTARGWD
jgi:hypothetical protein